MEPRRARFQNPDGTTTPATAVPIASAAGVTAGAVPFLLVIQPTLPGVYTLEAWLEDTAGAASRTLEGTFNATAGGAAPVLSALSFEPKVGEVGATVAVAGTVAVVDPDGDAATWHAQITPPTGSALPEVSGTIPAAAAGATGAVPFTLSFTPTAAGAFTLTLTAKDAAGNTSAAVTGTLTVADTNPGNKAPTVSGLTFEPTTVALGKTISITGSFTAEDVDGNLKARYVRFKTPDGTELPPDGGLISGPSDQKSAVVPFKTTFDADLAGDYALEVWVEDKDGELSNVISGVLNVPAVQPGAPVLTDLTYFPKTGKTGQSLAFHGDLKFTDSDGDVGTLRARLKLPDSTYAGDTEKVLTQPKAGAAQFDFYYTPPLVGDHTLEVWIEDKAGNDSNVLTGLVSITDGAGPVNKPPLTANLQFAPSAAFVGDFVKMTGTFDASDLDGNLSVLFVRILKPDGSALPAGGGVISGASGQLSAVVPFTTYFDADLAGTYTVEAWVKDTDGALSNVTTGSLVVAEIDPTPPVVTKFELTPKAVKTGLAVTYSGKVGFKDADGDLVSLRLRVERPDGTFEAPTIIPVSGLASKYAGSVLYSFSYTASVVGAYTVEAWLVDAKQMSSAVFTVDVVVTAPFIAANQAPVASSLVFDPVHVVVGEAVTVTGTFVASDVDGNMTSRFARVIAPDGSPLATSSAGIAGPVGQTSANVSFTYGFVPTVTGIYSLEVYCKDDDEAFSNTLAGTLEVVAADPTAPAISELVVSPSVANTGVSASYAGQLTFTDSDGDVDALHLRWRRPGDAVTAETVVPVTGLPSPMAGSIPVAMVYTAPAAGSYMLEVWAQDAAGQKSNVLTHAVVVTSVPKVNNSVPVAANLVVTPASAFTGQATTLSGTVDVTDIDANLATLFMKFKKPSGLSLPEQSTPLVLPDPSGGEASFTLGLTPDVAGTWTLEVYAKDTSGAKSNTLSGTVAVTAPPSTVPVATAITVSPTAVDAGVSVMYAGTVLFTDHDGDLSTVHVRFKRPGGTVSAETVIPVSVLPDPSAGEAPFSLAYTATVGGAYTIEAWVKDAKGQKSNTVATPITVAAVAVGTNSAPVIEDLVFTPKTAPLGIPASVVGTVFATDLDSNWATAHYRFRRPSGTALPEAIVNVNGLTGQTSGSIAFTRPLTPDAAGVWSLEVTLKDAAGAQSATLAGEITVEPKVLPDATAPVIGKLTVQPLAVLIDKTKTLVGSVAVSDSDGDSELLTIAIVDPTGTPLPETVVTLTGFSGQTTFTAPFSMEFTAEMVGDYVLEAWIEDLEGQSSNIAAATIVANDLSNVNSACAALETDCTGQGFCYDVNSTTCDYLEDKQIDFATCDEVGPTGTVAACVSSIEDTSSPYASTDANCGFVQYWSNPTVFPIDCRCGDSAFESPCKRPYELSSVITYGEGPRPRDLASEMRLWNGPLLGREWFVPAFWKTSSKPNQTMIYAIHLDTGNRRYFSGTYNDPANGLTRVGNGPDFVQVMDMDIGPDGQFYAVGAASEISEPKIWRVNPANGDRTLIFDAATAPASALCPNGSTLPGLKVVQMAAQGWAMDSQGRFYFSNVNQPGPSIVRIAADGKSCDYVTSVVDVPSNSRENVGGGYDDFQFDFRAFHIKGDKLYTVTNTMFVEVDIPTGSRKLLSKATDIGNIGAGPINAEGLADRYTRWDPYRNVYWTVGIQGGNGAVVVDPTTGNRATWPCWHPTLGGPLTGCGGTGKALIPGYLNFGGFIIDPEGDHNLYFAHDLFAIVKYDVKTGNAYTFSL